MIPSSTLPSRLVGFSTTNFTQAEEPTLSWNQFDKYLWISNRTAIENCFALT